MLICCLALQESASVLWWPGTPICGMYELVYIYTYFLSVDLFRSTIIVFRYDTLNILIGIKLPSLPVSALYLENSVVWLDFVLSLETINAHTLRKFKLFDLTASDSSVDTCVFSTSWCVSWTYLCFSLIASLISPLFDASAHPFKIICSATGSTFITIGWTFSWFM